MPVASVLERLVVQVYAETHGHLYDVLCNHLPTEVKYAIDKLLLPHAGGQPSLFYLLKEYPPSASIASIQNYLERYRLFDETSIDTIQVSLDPAFIDYLNRLTRRYNAKEIKRFNEPKRYALIVCFLLETSKVLLDHLVKIHDQFIMDMLRKAKQHHEKKHREFRKRQKKAVDRVLESTHIILDWPDDQPFYKADFWQCIDEKKLLESIDDLYIFKRLEERGYGDMLVSRYPSLRKYFAEFIQLPFAAKPGTERLS
ncbi:MAG: hypothetical protein PHD43_08120 [Methylococcales bacterium]|nr:hypothetical protein [Methylococcales bacterium]